MDPQTWWKKNAKEQLPTFMSWVGDDTAPTKVYSAKYCVEKAFKSVIDLGAATATFGSSLQKHGFQGSYVAADTCEDLLSIATSNGFLTLTTDLRETILDDNSFEWAFSRHTWEHQPNFVLAANEALRICSKEMCHIFFISPLSVLNSEVIYDPNSDLYHNRYSRGDIENWISSNSKIASFQWVDFGKEAALHIVKR